jgi:MFS superfamily sulfate permease-like transporter
MNHERSWTVSVNKESTATGFFSTLKFDLPASIATFLVALPLCMGIAIASGVPVAAGLITGIVGGLVVGTLAGAPLQVSGPAAGLTVVVYEIVQTFGLAGFGVVVMGAGILQILAGTFRLGQWFRAVSPAVIHGMLAGIGVLIFASQFHVMIDDKPKESGLRNLATIPQAVAKGLPWPAEGAEFTVHQKAASIGLLAIAALLAVHQKAASIGLLAIAALLVWQKFGAKRIKFIPAPLVAVVVAAVAAYLWQLPVNYVSVPDSLVSTVHLPSLGILQEGHLGTLIEAICVMALIASAETLLCATAVDKMHSGPRTNYDRELMAQGLGNTICGLVGALPMTGVIVRSAANVQAGAKTRKSAILHGLWLLVFVSFLTPVLRLIPVAGLAAVLVYTGYKLVNLKHLAELKKYGWSEVGIYVATLVTIVVEDLLTGVVVGIVLSAAKLLYTFAHLRTDVMSDPNGNRVTLALSGTATFLRLPRLAAALERVPANAELHVDLEQLHYIDHACFDLLMNWAKQHELAGGKLVMDWNCLHAQFDREAAPFVRKSVA